MKINLSSLASDSFVLGPPNLISQMCPEKILNVRGVHSTSGKEALDHGQLWGVEIHLTSNCQLRCRRCSYGQRNKNYSELKETNVENILSFANNMKAGSIIFSGGGDPLSWKSGRLHRILEHDTVCAQSIATNGLGIIKNLTRDSLCRLSIVQINILGYDKPSFLQTTQKDMFDDYYENIQWLFKNRNKRTTQLTGKILIDNKNYKNIIKYMWFCCKLGFDLIVVKLAGDFERGQKVSLTNNQKLIVRDLIYSSVIISEYPAYIDAISSTDNALELSMPQKCWFVEKGMYMLIRSDGDVFPCVASPYTKNNSIGNIHQSLLMEIWEGERHHTIKKKLHNDMKKRRCNLNVCRHLRYNFVLEKHLHKPNAQINDRLLRDFQKPPILL